MINHDEWLIVGIITSPQGIHGIIKVNCLSHIDERYTNNNPIAIVVPKSRKNF